jgi:YtoQ family protein
VSSSWAAAAVADEARVFLVNNNSSRWGEDMERLPLWYVFRMGRKQHRRTLTVLALIGEIHSDWRQEIADGIVQQQHLGTQIRLTSPSTCHVDSDDCGAYILGMVDDRQVWDGLGARMNQIRNQTLLQQADIVVVKFGDRYRQWNVAFDAGYAVALHKPLIVLHDPAHNLSHMLKEITAAAAVVCATPIQVVQTLDYVITGRLPAQPKDGVNYIPIADRLGKGNPNP